MQNDRITELRTGLEAAFIDSNVEANLALKPQFVSNNYREGRKVLSLIEGELLSCQEFCISVAFITKSGITPLLQTLKELEARGVPGRILTTDYLNFSDPEALEKLASLKNLEVRMYFSEDEGFHTKGYIFRDKNLYRILVGSSNLTMSALTTNREWNTKIVSTDRGEYAEDILAEFQELWFSEKTFAYEDCIDRYTVAYQIGKKQRALAKEAIRAGNAAAFEMYKLKPNAMQVDFIENLKEIRDAGKGRALLLSATGTGKT